MAEVRARFADAAVADERDALLLPGLVDCHVHFPQIRVIGAMGLELMDWLRLRSLPEEARLADGAYGTAGAREFVRSLAANGTTTSLVFGSHFPGAQEALFSAAFSSGLRMVCGLVVSDRGLLPELEVRAEVAFETSLDLIERCPSSNAFLGNGLFPLRRHFDAEVRVALGTDVGAGTGLSMLGEGLMAYHVQRLSSQGCPLGAAHLLYLATLAGGVALGIEEEVGDLTPSKSADFVLVRPPEGSTLAAVLAHSESLEDALGTVFTLAREESIAEVRVGGEVVWPPDCDRRAGL